MGKAWQYNVCIDSSSFHQFTWKIWFFASALVEEPQCCTLAKLRLILSRDAHETGAVLWWPGGVTLRRVSRRAWNPPAQTVWRQGWLWMLRVWRRGLQLAIKLTKTWLPLAEGCWCGPRLKGLCPVMIPIMATAWLGGKQDFKVWTYNVDLALLP